MRTAAVAVVLCGLLAAPAYAAKVLTLKQARTETARVAKLRAGSVAGYPDRVRYHVDECKRTSDRRFLCEFRVLKDLDDGRLMTCFYGTDIRMRRAAKRPYTFSVGQHGECKRS